MNKRILRHFFLTFPLQLLMASLSLADCNIPVRTKSYEKYSAGTYYDVLTVPKSALAELLTSRLYNYAAHFQKTTQAKTKTDMAFLLERQKKFFKNFPEDVRRFDKVLNKKIGRVRGISCLENFLLDNHLRTFSGETEFSAFVLTKPELSEATVVIYTQIKNGTVSDDVVTRLVEDQRKQGWNVESHIHNHPFNFKNPYGDIAGTILPSSTDIASYRTMAESLRLRSAVVTNGFQSFILYRNDFEKF